MQFWSQSQEGMGLAMFDLDHFKAVNDNHGHQAGDRVLVEFSGLLQKMAVRSERVIRFGGEEFVVLMPGADLKRSHRRAEKMRQAVADHPFPLRGSASLTTSVGVAAANPLREAGLSRAEVPGQPDRAAGRRHLRERLAQGSGRLRGRAKAREHAAKAARATGGVKGRCATAGNRRRRNRSGAPWRS